MNDDKLVYIEERSIYIVSTKDECLSYCQYNSKLMVGSTYCKNSCKYNNPIIIDRSKEHEGFSHNFYCEKYDITFRRIVVEITDNSD